MKLIVIGGVAGGASAAAKARRLNEDAEIIMFERGEYISFANCGLPYHIGEVIPARESLLVMTPEGLRERTNMDIRTRHEVVKIDAEAKTVTVRNLETGDTYDETYDKLIMSPGSSPLRPPIKGADDPDVMVLWTMNDMDAIKKRVDSGIKKAVVIGGGFIGVEIAENLQERGVETTLVEMLPQLLPPLDVEMSQPLTDTMICNGINVLLNNGVTEIKRTRDAQDHHVNKVFNVTLKDGSVIETELVIMSVGVRPNSSLAKEAGLDVNERGGIIVNNNLETSNPDIYAVGDAIQVNDPICGGSTMIPLAGPANRQGRMAAINAFGGEEKYYGTIGTSVCKVFDLTAAATGASEKLLIRNKVPYKKLYLNPGSHASYYPGSQMLNMKVLFNDEGKILGAQVIGQVGADKRIDVLATAIRMGMTMTDLEELELAYAPPYGSAKDPINFVGFIGNNILRGDSVSIAPNEIPEDSILLDIRETDEVICGAFPNSINIPLGELRDRMSELPKDKLIISLCKMGARGYLAERILKAHGYNAANLAGGIASWKLFNPDDVTPLTCAMPKTAVATSPGPAVEGNIVEINACGLACPGPIMAVKKKIDSIDAGVTLKVSASERGFMKDLPAWCSSTGNELIDIKWEDNKAWALVRKGLPSGIETKTTTNAVTGEKRTTIVLFSCDMDKALAAFIISIGFATLGHKVSIFCTFWGINVLRKDQPPAVKKNFISRMFGMMMPTGARKLALSNMHMMGMGTGMMKSLMKKKSISSLPELIAEAQGMGVKLLACEMAMDLMGIQQAELLDGTDLAGVANFASLSEKSTTTLFI